MSTPRRPTDLGDDLTLGALVTVYHSHRQALTDAHLGLGQSQTAADLADHALATLATIHAIASKALRPRWFFVVDALTYGAPLDDVCAAMGLTGDEVRVGLRSWVDGQLRLKLLTDAEADKILALLGGAR